MTEAPTQPRAARSTKKFRGKLAHRMILLLVPAVLLPVIAIGVIITRRSQAMLQQQVGEQLLQAERNMQAQINEWLLAKSARVNVVTHRETFAKAAHDLLTRGHHEPRFHAAQQEVIDELKAVNLRETHPLFTAFLVLSPDYRIIASSRPAWIGLELRDSALAKLIAQIGKKSSPQGLSWFNAIPPSVDALTPNAFGTVHFLIHATPPVPSAAKQGQRSILFSVTPYTDVKSGQSLYIVGISEELALEELLQNLSHRYPSSIGYFLLPDGTYLSIDPATNSLVAQKAPSALLQGFSPETDFAATAQYLSPIRQVKAFSVAQWIPELNAAIGLEIPYSILTQRPDAMLPFARKLLFFVALFIAGIIWLMAVYISRPIMNVAQTARSFAEGDWSARSPVTRNDEIGLLAHTFNQMADEISQFYRSLEQQVQERTAQVRTASEVAALAASATDLSEIMRRTVNLIVTRFPQYYHASVFLIDENNDAVLEESTGPVGEQMKRQGHRLKVGSPSVVGWAAQHRQPRIASDVAEDPIHFKNPLLPETRSEAGIPLIVGDRVVGVLDVQSKNPHAFDEQSVVTLQTLASQLAAAIHNAQLREQAEMGLGETQKLYQISRRLASARTADDIIEVSVESLKELPFISALFVLDEQGSKYRLLASHHPENPESPLNTTYTTLPVNEIKQYLPDNSPLVFNDLRVASNRNLLTQLASSMGCASATYLTVSADKKPIAIVILGSQQPGAFTIGRLQPYTTLAEIASAALERTNALVSAERRLQEFRVIVRLIQSIGKATSPGTFYRTLYEELRQLFGEVGLMVALYDPLKRQIEVPYAHEQGQEDLLRIAPFTLGEGLLSHVINTRQPLLITRDAEERLRQLGAKVAGRPAKSWLGVPLITGDQLIGALVLQDIENENRFKEEDVNFVTAIATSIALLLHKIRLVARTENAYQRERLLFNISQQAQTANINEMLQTAITGLQNALHAHRGVIHLRMTTTQDGNTADASGDNA